MRIPPAPRPSVAAWRGLLLLSIVLVGTAGGCQSDRPDRVPDGADIRKHPVRPARPTVNRQAQTMHRRRVERLRRVCSWAPVFGGFDAAELQDFDMVVVDAVRSADGDAGTSKAEVAALRRRGVLVLAYLSVGTVEDWRHYASSVPRSWTLGAVEGWAGERYVDARQAGWRRLMAREAETMAAQGLDGLYLDNLDVAEDFPKTSRGVVALVKQLRAAAPALLLVAQNGLAVDHRLPVDAVAHEDVFARWDDGYRRSTAAETADVLPKLRRLHRRGLPIFTLDYAEPGSSEAQAALQQSLVEGFHPAVSVLDLDRLPHAVPRCPEQGGRGQP
jgi:uncharacterized protein (TIGR01370 family)